MARSKVTELKRCPFCGGNATLQREYFELSEDELFYVRCEDCGGYLETPEEAVEAWNERPENQIEIIPRRPFLDDTPDGLVESDRDFVMNNFDACVAFLERLEDIRNV